MIRWAALNTVGYCLWRIAVITGERMAACSGESCVVIALGGSGRLGLRLPKTGEEEEPGGDDGIGAPSSWPFRSSPCICG